MNRRDFIRAALGSVAALGLARVIPQAARPQARAGRIYYITGRGFASDRNDGLSPDRVWRSLARLNQAELQPGDVVVMSGTFEAKI